MRTVELEGFSLRKEYRLRLFNVLQGTVLLILVKEGKQVGEII